MKNMNRRFLFLPAALLCAGAVLAQDAADDWHAFIDAETEARFDEVVEWRRHFHQHPELSSREFETAEHIADFLRGLGMQVTTGELMVAEGVL